MICQSMDRTSKRVLFLYQFLDAICAEPSKYARDETLLLALSRQERLGKFSSVQYGVQATSRSTIERVCARYHNEIGDFQEKRLAALGALKDIRAILSREERPRRRTAQAYQDQARAGEREVLMRRVDCMQLTRALCKALEAGRNIAAMSDRDAAIDAWARHERVVLAMMTLSKHLVVRKASDEEAWARNLFDLKLL